MNTRYISQETVQKTISLTIWTLNKNTESLIALDNSPSWIFQNVSLDGIWNVCIVVANADVASVDLILIGHLL